MKERMKKLRKNHKGFSLVELIIVIAIMAILVGILAPQFIKYVNNSRISADVTSCDNAVQAINAAVADGTITATPTDFAAACTSAGTTAPSSKLSGTWSATFKTDFSVDTVTLTVNSVGYQVYPDPDDGTNGINEKLKK